MGVLRSLLECLWSPFCKTSPAPVLPPAELLTSNAPATGPDEPNPPPDDDLGAWWHPEPAPELPAPPPPLDDEMAQKLHTLVTAMVEGANADLPRLSHVTERALMMMRDPEVDYRRLADVVAADPGQTARILRVANSALYGGTSKISSLHPAFARLGYKQIRYIFLTSSLQTLGIQIGGANRTLSEDIWRQALAGGAIAGALAGKLGMVIDDAALLGLLHDLGRFVVLTASYTLAKETRQRVPRPVFDAVADHWHEQAGLRLADAWGLPDPIPAMVADHHRLPAAGEPWRAQRLLVMTTDVIASLLHYAPFHPHDFFATPCVRELGLVPDPATRAFLDRLPGMIEARMADFQ